MLIPIFAKMGSMKCKNTVWVLFLIFTTESWAYDIAGKVVDGLDNSPIIGAHLVIKNSSPLQGCTTDIHGEFLLTGIALEEIVLQVSYVGYQLKEIAFTLEGGERANVMVHLEADMLEDLVINASKEMVPINEFAEVSFRSISMDDADKLPGGFNDIGRMAQNFPGVQKSNDASNEIVVRGNNPGSVLWRIEGIDVPSPNHFAEFGSSGGPLSLLNTNTIQNSDFYTGAFPAEFGNATGAAFDIRLKNGNSEKIGFMGQLGFNGMELMIDGPLKRGSESTFLVNYRNSNLTLLEKMNLIDFDIHLGVPTFNDLAFKINVPTQKSGRFSVFGITGKSDISTEASRIIRKENASEDAKLKAKDEGMDEHYGSLTGIYGMNHDFTINQHTNLQSGISYTRSQSYLHIDTLDQNYNPHRNYAQRFLENRFVLRSKLNHQLNQQNLLSTGITYTHFLFDYSQTLHIRDANVKNPGIEENGNDGLVQAFAQYRFQTENEKLSLSPGIHYQHFFFNNTYAIEPRLSIGYHISDAHKLSLGVGKHSQILPVNVYFKNQAIEGEREVKDHELGFQKSIHFVLAHHWNLNDKFRVNSELYYQSLNSIPVDYEATNSWSLINGMNSEFNGNPPQVLISEGLGKNYGIDVSFEYLDKKGWHGMLNTSLYQSKYAGSDGIWRNTTWNGNYLFNLIVGKEIPVGNHRLNFDLKANWTGGRRYTPIDLDASRKSGRTVRFHENAYTETYPDYFKMDFRVGYQLPLGRTSHEFVLDFQNITNRENVFYQTYSQSSGEIKTINQLGFFPVFQYRIFF